ncbi:MAG: 16S rRNA (guanine(966)-N(2))-methyltransferase RsmD [Spirochaetaceae bacterium]|nr:16S rRNA (guanine(966)-N(2))-methyltransferase RsmD [Spirochaetaceae bacterium]
MRITGGIYCNRRIKCPKGVIRPAMDRMRESMFSILGGLYGLSFLDLFSGSGIVGIEAASRGASSVTFVEKDRIKKVVLHENVKIADNCKTEIFIMPAERFISLTKNKFDIVFLDPPFPLKKKQELLELVSKKNILNPSGLVIIHHPVEEIWQEKIDTLLLEDKRKYGRSILLFYRYNVQESN